MKKRTKNILISTFWIILYFFIIIITWWTISSFLINKESVNNIVTNFGIFAPLIFVLLQITQNVVAPIAHYPLLLAGGFIFGPVKGFFYNWIGTVLGTILIIILTKKFGRPLVKKMISQKFINKYDHIINKISPFTLFLIYFLPLFPDDEITYLIGLSSMPTKHLIFAIILGKTGGATLSIIGNDPINGIIPTLIINVLLLLVGIICYFWKNILSFFKLNYLIHKRKY
jgi:uncharacterized membrane protein YdjX (TVP38/TMEM64 family)